MITASIVCSSSVARKAHATARIPRSHITRADIIRGPTRQVGGEGSVDDEITGRNTRQIGATFRAGELDRALGAGHPARVEERRLVADERVCRISWIELDLRDAEAAGDSDGVRAGRARLGRCADGADAKLSGSERGDGRVRRQRHAIEVAGVHLRPQVRHDAGTSEIVGATDISRATADLHNHIVGTNAGQRSGRGDGDFWIWQTKTRRVRRRVWDHRHRDVVAGIVCRRPVRRSRNARKCLVGRCRVHVAVHQSLINIRHTGLMGGGIVEDQVDLGRPACRLRNDNLAVAGGDRIYQDARRDPEQRVTVARPRRPHWTRRIGRVADFKADIAGRDVVANEQHVLRIFRRRPARRGVQRFRDDRLREALVRPRRVLVARSPVEEHGGERRGEAERACRRQQRRQVGGRSHPARIERRRVHVALRKKRARRYRRQIAGRRRRRARRSGRGTGGLGRLLRRDPGLRRRRACRRVGGVLRGEGVRCALRGFDGLLRRDPGLRRRGRGGAGRDAGGGHGRRIAGGGFLRNVVPGVVGFPRPDDVGRRVLVLRPVDLGDRIGDRIGVGRRIVRMTTEIEFQQRRQRRLHRRLVVGDRLPILPRRDAIEAGLHTIRMGRIGVIGRILRVLFRAVALPDLNLAGRLGRPIARQIASDLRIALGVLRGGVCTSCRPGARRRIDGVLLGRITLPRDDFAARLRRPVARQIARGFSIAQSLIYRDDKIFRRTLSLLRSITRTPGVSHDRRQFDRDRNRCIFSDNEHGLTDTIQADKPRIIIGKNITTRPLGGSAHDRFSDLSGLFQTRSPASGRKERLCRDHLQY